MENVNEKRIDEFFSEINPWFACYRVQTLSYFGVQKGDEVIVSVARLRFSVSGSEKELKYRAGKFIAGQLSIKKFSKTAESFVKLFSSGKILSLPDGRKFSFVIDSKTAETVTSPNYLHPEGLSTGRRLAVLTIYGGNDALRQIPLSEADWELKAGKEPFDSLQELLAALQLGGHHAGVASFEVIAHTPTEILVDSIVDGDLAKLGLWLPSPLKRALGRINYRVIDKGNVVSRGTIPSSKMKWENRNKISVGLAQIKVPRAAVINCTAIYADKAHHQSWIGDPNEIQNPRLQAFTTTDPALQTLKRYLIPPSIKGAAASQFETAVSWMLWAYGLSTAHMGLADQAKDGPDILAFAPNGGCAVVECTLGLLKEDSKLAKVARRTIAIKKKMEDLGMPNLSVLAVIVTLLTRKEVEMEIDTAIDSNVLVLTRENLEAALNEVLVYPDGDRFFKRGLDALAQEKEILKQKRVNAAA